MKTCEVCGKDIPEGKEIIDWDYSGKIITWCRHCYSRSHSKSIKWKD